MTDEITLVRFFVTLQAAHKVMVYIITSQQQMKLIQKASKSLLINESGDMTTNMTYMFVCLAATHYYVNTYHM